MVAMITETWQIIVHLQSGHQVYPLSHHNCWSIGRGIANAIVISDIYLSRHHATLQMIGGQLFFIDLNSRNGSFVNGRRVITPIILRHGDQLRLGNSELEAIVPMCRRHPHPLPDQTIPLSDPVLTPSEEKVFWQVVQGFTNKEIGRRLQISPRTVQTHLSSIMTKLTLENRSQIVRFAFEQRFRQLDKASQLSPHLC